MKHIIRSTRDGRPIPSLEVEDKRGELAKRLLNEGKQYILYEAYFATATEDGEFIEEQVTIIEELSECRIL